MNQDSYERDEFHNTGFFFLPLKADHPDKLNTYLKSDVWSRSEPDAPYLLYYAPSAANGQDDRLKVFRYNAPNSLPLYDYDSQIHRNTVKDASDRSGHHPVLHSVMLYLFGTNIAFLEFCIRYDGMNAREITNFTYYFRSLRFDEEHIAFEAGKISLKTAVERILPPSESSTTLCFSNPSDLKKQASVFSILLSASCEMQSAETERFCHLLAHGYHTGFAYHSSDESPYEMQIDFGGDTLMGGSQDGMVCIAEKPHPFQYARLCKDYRYLYLLLLNQRLASIAYIEAFSRSGMTLSCTRALHNNVVSLKTRYSYRVISDDRQIQTVYNEMYRIFELDNLLEDLEDSTDQLNELLQEQRYKHDRRFEMLLGALSVLAVFSALIDLSDYLDRFSASQTLHTILSLSTTVLILIVASVLIFRREK